MLIYSNRSTQTIMSKKDAPVDAPAKSGKGKFIVLALVGLLLGVGGGGAGAYMLLAKKKAAAAESEEHAEPSAKPPAAVKKSASVFLPLDTFVVNLADTENERYMQLGIVLELSDAATGETIKNQMPAVRNRILLLASSKLAKDLSTRAGKEALANEILAETKRVLSPKGDVPQLEGVHFASLIVQ